jgi:hypothetical protein
MDSHLPSEAVHPAPAGYPSTAIDGPKPFARSPRST